MPRLWLQRDEAEHVWGTNVSPRYHTAAGHILGQPRWSWHVNGWLWWARGGCGYPKHQWDLKPNSLISPARRSSSGFRVLTLTTSHGHHICDRRRWQSENDKGNKKWWWRGGTKHIPQQWISCLKECHLGLNVERERGGNTETRAGAGVRERGKVGVQLGPIRAGPHVPTGGTAADRGGRREQRGQQGGSAESDGPRPCEALLGLSSALLNGAAHTRLQKPATPHPSHHHHQLHLHPPTIPCPPALPGQNSIKLLGGGRQD